MKTMILVILLSSVLLIPVSAMSAKDLFEKIIERIERKYDEIRAKAPSVKARGKAVAKSIRFIQPEDRVIEDYSKLKQIALIRHGEPDMEKSGRFSSAEAQQFLKCYDSVCIIVPDEPFFRIRENEQVKVFSSPINRAFSTAEYLCGYNNYSEDITTSPVFREFEIKIKKSDSEKKKSVRFWRTKARMKWMLGLGDQQGIESFREAKDRAERAAKMLNEASSENPKVLLTAHGFVNRYIKKDLKKMGWKVVEDTGNDYFGTTILVKIE